MIENKGRLPRLQTALRIFFLTCALTSAGSYGDDWIYVVSDGDTLSGFGQKYLGSQAAWKKVQKLNQLPDPNWISPGTRLRIPMSWLTSNTVPARVLVMQGEAQLTRKDGSILGLQSGNVLQLGDKVSTASGASVSIEFADASVVTLDGGSELLLDHLSAYGETGMVDSRMRLLQGRLETRVTPASGPGSRFEIHTASAISAVRGTAYRIAAGGDDMSSSFEVTGGVVDVSDAGDTDKARVNKGFGTIVAKGQAPLAPRELLPAPALDILPDELDRFSWPVSWAAVEGAKQYRVQLSDSPGFETLRMQSISADRRLRLPDIPDGDYHLRVRGIDELGLEGMDQTAQLLQNATPYPPVQLQPEDGAVFVERAPRLYWSRSPEASSYRLQIARDPQFKQLILDKPGVRDLEFSDRRCAQVGTWHWRVAGIDADGNSGPFGAPRQFSVKQAQATPGTRGNNSGGVMTISWRAGDTGANYRAQIARDMEFHRLLLDVHLTEPNVTVERPDRKLRYFRVETTDPVDGISQWSAIQEIPPISSAALP